jgi:hypothetical protein
MKGAKLCGHRLTSGIREGLEGGKRSGDLGSTGAYLCNYLTRTGWPLRPIIQRVSGKPIDAPSVISAS